MDLPDTFALCMGQESCGSITVLRLSDVYHLWRHAVGSGRGCKPGCSNGLKEGKGVSNSIVQPTNVGGTNCDVIK